MTIYMPFRRFSAIVLLIFASVICSMSAWATNRYVPGSYSTIQAAINSSADGDVVIVSAGTYVENIDFIGKAITVRSTDPADPAVVAATIVDGNDAGSVVTFVSSESNTSILSGLTITNGSDSGIYISQASPTIQNCIISGNTSGNTSSYSGGGIYIYNSDSSSLVNITNNTIDGNTSSNNGGGIYIYTSSHYSSITNITNNIIIGNTATNGDGGGIYNNIYGSDSITNITNNTISGNESSKNGGGIYTYSDSSSLTNMTNNTISGNTATNGDGGGIYTISSQTNITNNTINGNISSNNGGGIYTISYSSSTNITNNAISGNTATNGDGGGIYNSYSSFATNITNITNNAISGNTATNGDGGGIYTYSHYSSITNITNNIISKNTAAGYGGGIYLRTGESTLINSCSLNANSATNGGGIFCYSHSSTIINTIIAYSTTGGGIKINGTQKTTVQYCDVYSNTGGNYLGMANPTGANGNISTDPLFADAVNGDFHLKSKGGRWNGTTWVKDSIHSPCIDTGDPTSDYSLEPAGNGGCINMGAYGNTTQASKWEFTLFQSDALVYDPTLATYQGGNIYNTTAQWQTIDGDTYAGRKATFYVRGQNDGNLDDKLCFKGPASDAKWSVKYIDSTTANDITADVIGPGWHTPLLSIGSLCSIKVEVTPALIVKPGEVYPINITVSSDADPTKEDTVKIIATMKNTSTPDARIHQASSGTYIGDGIYNSTGVGQAETKQVYAGVKTAFYIQGQNDSNYADYIVFKAPAGSDNWNIKYVDSATGNDITASVTSTGWQTPTTVPIGSTRSIKVEVTSAVTVTPGKKLDLAVSVYMASDMTRRDVVYCTTQTIYVYQPDGSAYQLSSGSYIGGYLYNTTGSGQTETRTINRGTKTTYYFRMRNNGNVAETFNLTAPAGDGNWLIKYVDSTTGVDVTADITSGMGYTSVTIPRSGSRSMKVEVTALNSLGVGVELPVLVTIKSNTEPAKVDAVKFVTTTK